MRASYGLLIALLFFGALLGSTRALESQVDPDRRGDVLVTDPDGNKKEDVDTQEGHQAFLKSDAKTEEAAVTSAAEDDEEEAAAGAAHEIEEEDEAAEEASSADEDGADEVSPSPSLIEQNAQAQVESAEGKPGSAKAKVTKAKASHSKAKPTAAKHRFTNRRRRRTGADDEDADESAQSPSWILPLAPAGYGGPGVINPYSNVNPLNPMAAQMQAEAGGNGAGGPPQAQMGPAQNNNAGVTPSSFIEVGEITQNKTAPETPAVDSSLPAPSSSAAAATTTTSTTTSPSTEESVVWTVTPDTDDTAPTEAPQTQQAQHRPEPRQPEEEQQHQQQQQQPEEEQQLQEQPEEEQQEEQPKQKHQKKKQASDLDSLSFDRAFMKNIESVFQDVLRDAHEKRAAQFDDESSHLLDLTRWDQEPHVPSVAAKPQNKESFDQKVEEAINKALQVASTSPKTSTTTAVSSASSVASSPLSMLLRDKDEAVTTIPDSAPIDTEPLPSNIQPALPPIVSDITEIREAMEADGELEGSQPLAIVVKSPLRSFLSRPSVVPSAARLKTERRKLRRFEQQAPSQRQLEALFHPMSAAALMPLPFIPLFSPDLKMMFSPPRPSSFSSPSSDSSSDFSWPVVHNSIRISEEKDRKGRVIGLRDFNHKDSEEDESNDQQQLKAATAELAKDMTQLVRQLVMPKDEALSKPARLEVVQVMPVAGGVLIRDEKIQEVDSDEDDNTAKIDLSPNPLSLLGASLAAGGTSGFPSLVQIEECHGCEFPSQELDDVAAVPESPRQQA